METKSALAALAALAQETRLAIFRLLVAQGPQGMSAGRIGEALRVPAATLSFHLKELAHAGLIASRQESRFVWYSADFAVIGGLVGFLTENCCGGQPELCFPAAPACCPPASAVVPLPLPQGGAGARRKTPPKP